MLLLSLLYPLVVLGIAQTGPAHGEGVSLMHNGRKAGYILIGQSFKSDRYFNSRPSAVDYHADGSGGSNKGPTNPEYLQTVKARVDTLLVHNPTLRRGEVPAELVTASGSGLDPHLSPQGALVQVSRIARLRGLTEDQVRQLVSRHTQGPLLGLFGTATVNVLELNLALDEMK